jgi:hypothetical protein
LHRQPASSCSHEDGQAVQAGRQDNGDAVRVTLDYLAALAHYVPPFPAAYTTKCEIPASRRVETMQIRRRTAGSAARDDG